MTRYIECEAACAEVDKGDLLIGNNAEFAKEIINRTPAADVVLKSEVDYWRKQCFHACMNNGCLDPNIITRLFEDAEGHADPVGAAGVEGEDGHGDLSLLYRRSKATVARKIFEEIDSKIITEIDLSNAVLIEFEGAEEIYNRIKGEVSAMCKLRDFIAELRKHYESEGTDNG